MLAAAARWQTRARLVYGWDSVHYILAQDRYDILAHQPHPPGSYYYVLLARVARLATGDPHTALLLLSSLFGGVLVVALYLLGRELSEGETGGWLAAAIGATAPLFWFYGSVDLNYGPAGALSALFALGCVLALKRASSPHGPCLLAGISLGLLGGFRPTDVVFLFPAYLWTLACAYRRQPGRALLTGPAAAALLTLGWLLPTLQSAGGPATYLASLRGQEHLLSRSSALLAGWPALLDARFTHERTLQSLLGAAWLPAGLGFLAWGAGLRHREQRAVDRPHAVLGLLIVAPAFLFYLLVHFNSPGYALTYAGYLAAVGAALCARLAAGLRARTSVPWSALLAVAIVLGNGVLFLRGWPGMAKFGQRSLSAAEIRDHDRYYREVAAYLRHAHPAGNVRLLCSWSATDGLRVAQTLLPYHAPQVAQAVERVPDLPPTFAALSWLRLITPEQVRGEGRPVYAVFRTWEDPPYHQGLFPEGWEEVPIGPGHVLYRLRRDGDR